VRGANVVTSASSALGVLNDYALYKSTHALTHSRDFSADRPIAQHRHSTRNDTSHVVVVFLELLEPIWIHMHVDALWS